MSADQGRPGAHNDSLHGELERAHSVMLLSPTLSEAGRDACFDLCLPTDPTEENIIIVSYRQSAEGTLRDWRDRIGEPAAKMKVITMDESQRTASNGGVSTDDYGNRVVTSIEHPSDLTGLGIALSQQLEKWGQSDRETVLCFDSITVMLQYVDLQTVFRFLHVAINRLRAVDGVGHFHMDPSAHDEQTISRLAQLFDAIVEVDDDGVTVRSR